VSVEDGSVHDVLALCCPSGRCRGSMSLGWEESGTGDAAGWKQHRESLWRTAGPSSSCWYACSMHGSGVLPPRSVGSSVCECMSSVITGRWVARTLMRLTKGKEKRTDQRKLESSNLTEIVVVGKVDPGDSFYRNPVSRCNLVRVLERFKDRICRIWSAIRFSRGSNKRREWARRVRTTKLWHIIVHYKIYL